MKAGLILHEKFVNPDESVVEMKIWQVPKTPHYPMGVKYSLYWVKDGKILVGYDNHFPKGPHRHYGEREEEYGFTDVSSLIADFTRDLERINP